jgi:hypothetical protein
MRVLSSSGKDFATKAPTTDCTKDEMAKAVGIFMEAIANESLGNSTKDIKLSDFPQGCSVLEIAGATNNTIAFYEKKTGMKR